VVTFWVEAHARSLPRSQTLSRLAISIGVAFLISFLVVSLIKHASREYGRIQDYYEATNPQLGANDFPAFYGGAAASLQERGDLYDMRFMVGKIIELRDGEAPPPGFDPQDTDYAWLRYYNPPVYLLALSPLTLLDLHTAYLVMVGVNLFLLAGLIVCLGYVMRWKQPETLIFSLGLLVYEPIFFSLRHTQPTILIAILIGLSHLALRNGRYGLAGCALALCGIKPHWLLPLGALVWRERRLWKPFLATVFLVLALPFALLGPSAVIDYARLVLSRGNSDLTDTGFTTVLLSWTGFFRALTGEPQPQLWFLASAATLAAFAVIWRWGDRDTTFCAAIIVALLVIPHSHPQDWTLVAPVAAILLSKPSTTAERAGIGAVVMAIFIGANEWTEARWRIDYEGTAIYWVTIAGFSLVLWLAAVLIARRVMTDRKQTPQRSSGAQIPAGLTLGESSRAGQIASVTMDE
jgi:hypothetical protein